MARGRWISPDFYDSTTLAQCSHSARLVYPALWQCADRAGVFEWDEHKLRKYTFGYDNVLPGRFSEWMLELWSRGFIMRATWQGVDYGYIPKFPKRQSFHRDEKERHRDIADNAPWSAPGQHSASTGVHPCRSNLDLSLESLTESESITESEYRDPITDPQQILELANTEFELRPKIQKQKKQRTPSAPKASPLGYRETVDLWFVEYERYYKQKPAWGAVYGRQLVNLMGKADALELTTLIPAFFAWRRQEVINGGHSLSTGYASLAMKLDELRADLANPERRAFAADAQNIEHQDNIKSANRAGLDRAVAKIMREQQNGDMERLTGTTSPPNALEGSNQPASGRAWQADVGRSDGALAETVASVRKG